MPLSSVSRRFVPSLCVAALASALAGCGSGGSDPPQGPSCTLPAQTSLSVVEVTPANGATGVFVDTNVSIRFNTCIDLASIGQTGVMLMAGTSFVAFDLRYDAATATLVLDPTASLAYSRLHALFVTGVRGARGETMATGFGSSFTTQATPETIPPTTTASPAGGRYNTPQSVTLTCTDNAGGTGCAGTRYTLDGGTPTPLSPLYTAPISITADTVLRFYSVDAQGNAEAPKQESYVIDTVPPTFAGSDPPDGATGIALTKVLAAVFSEEMDPATLGADTVSADHGLTFGFSWDAPSRTLTLAPTERLVCGTTYHVSIGAGATDVAGNALVQPAAFSFTTQPDCVEPATAAIPPGGVTSPPLWVTLTCTDVGGSGCARIVYTTDGTMPSLVPPNGTVVTGASAGPIILGEGDTTLRFFAEDHAGNREALREGRYSISSTGFTFVAMNGGIARGVGPVPERFEPLLPGGLSHVFVRDPSNGRLYRGTERGLLVADAGEAFVHLPGSPTGVLSVLPQGSKIFAGAASGLFVSVDGGATFAQREFPPGCAAQYSCPGYVQAVVAEGQNVWAATDAGVAFSSDRGHTFALRTTADGLGADSVRDLVLAGGTLYAATANGVSISVDGGATFSNVTAGLGDPSVNVVVVSGATVYAGTEGGLSISEDGGATFTANRTTANGLGSDYVGALAFDGTRLYACTGLPWVSGTTDSFSISSDATGVSFTPHAIAPFDPTLRAQSVQVEGTTVRVGAYPNYYLSTDGGLGFASMDLRGSVEKLAGTTSGLDTALYAAISESAGHGGVAISTDHGASFVVRNEDDGLPFHNVDDVAASGSSVYAGTFWGLGVSTNGGASFANGPLGTSVDCVWASGTTVWACQGSTLQLSTSSGTSFEQRLATGSSGTAVAVHGANVYLSTTSGLWVSDASGAANTFVQRGAAEGLASTYLYDVAVDGAGTVLVAANGGFFRSDDAGATFTQVTTTPNYPRGVFAHGTTWYVAAPSNGVAISQDGGATWLVRGTAEGITSPGTVSDVWYMPP